MDYLSVIGHNIDIIMHLSVKLCIPNTYIVHVDETHLPAVLGRCSDFLWKAELLLEQVVTPSPPPLESDKEWGKTGRERKEM